MKRKLGALLAAVVLAFSLGACGDEGDEDIGPEPGTQQEGGTDGLDY